MILGSDCLSPRECWGQNVYLLMDVGTRCPSHHGCLCQTVYLLMDVVARWSVMSCIDVQARQSLITNVGARLSSWMLGLDSISCHRHWHQTVYIIMDVGARLSPHGFWGQTVYLLMDVRIRLSISSWMLRPDRLSYGCWGQTISSWMLGPDSLSPHGCWSQTVYLLINVGARQSISSWIFVPDCLSPHGCWGQMVYLTMDVVAR